MTKDNTKDMLSQNRVPFSGLDIASPWCMFDCFYLL